MSNSNTTHSGSPRKSKKQKRTVRSVFMTVFAVAFTLMPLMTIGLWVSQFVDWRGTTTLTRIDTPTTPPKVFDEPVVSVTFDDGWESIYTAMPLFDKYDIRTTQYIIGGKFDDKQYFSEAQVNTIVAAGHEVGSHTMSHADLTSLTRDQLEYELRNSKSALDFTHQQIKDFASPYGLSNPQVIDSVKQIYRSHRNTNADLTNFDDGDVNTRAKFNIYNINAYVVQNGDSTKRLKELFEYTKQQKAWLVICYHQVDESGSKFSVNLKTLEEQLQALRASGVRTAPVGEVLDNYKQGQEN